MNVEENCVYLLQSAFQRALKKYDGINVASGKVSLYLLTPVFRHAWRIFWLLQSVSELSWR